MKLFVALFAGLVPFAAATSTTGCNADNCARAVTGTRLGASRVSVARADCSTLVNAPAPTIPSYVKNCPDVEHYLSACNCWGIKPSCSNPGTCGTFVLINDPSCGELQTCTCAIDADGRPVCVQDVFCGGQTCNSDADCGAGKVCWSENCCGVNICAPVSNICPNPAQLMIRKVAAPTAAVKRQDCNRAAGCD